MEAPFFFLCLHKKQLTAPLSRKCYEHLVVMVCKNCGSFLPDGTLVCPFCGYYEKRVCQNCGTELPYDANVSDSCSNCGYQEKLGEFQSKIIGAIVGGLSCILIGSIEDYISVPCFLIGFCIIGACIYTAIKRKYVNRALFLYVIIASIIAPIQLVGCNEAQNKKAEAKAEARASAEAKKEKNKYAKFVGTYNLYDNEGNVGCDIIVTEDGRVFYDSWGENKFASRISRRSDDIFTVFIGPSGIYPNVDRVWSYKGNSNYTYRIRKYDGIKNTILLFDMPSKKMYISSDEYDNRDYTKPEYYKFKFRKK